MDKLDLGITKREAQGVMYEHGLVPREEVNRPAEGWPDKTVGWMDPKRWASVREQTLGKKIDSAEAYDAHHGLLGFGVVFLFYDGEERLMDKYRYQIN